MPFPLNGRPSGGPPGFRRLRLAALLLAVVLAPVAPMARAAEPLSALDIARLRSVAQVAIGPGGDRVAYLLDVPREPYGDDDGAAHTELHLVDAVGASKPFITGEVDLSRLAWRPDGGAVSYLAKRGDDEQKALYAIPVDGGESKRLVSHGADVTDYSWAPDGRRVAFLAERPESEEAKALKEEGFTQKVFEEEDRPVLVWIADLESESEGEPRPLELPGSASELRWAPAGDRLAVALAPSPRIDDHYMQRQIHVVDAASGEVTARVEKIGKLGEVAWSPDGRRLAFVSAADLNDPKEGRLMVVGAEGGAAVDLLPGLEGHVSDLAWLDADTVAFVADVGVGTRLAAVAAAGGPARDLAPAGRAVWLELSVSSDGRSRALLGSAPGHPEEVFLQRGDEPARRLTDSNPWLAERRLAEQEVVTYAARDGLELQGLLVRPLDVEAGQRVPLVLMVHGGPEAHRRHGWLTTYSRPSQVLAGLGIASFYPNYRGSTGRGVAFSKLGQGDPAGREFDDLVDAVDHLVALGLVDRDRVGITGGSYGGYATAWASTYYSERFAAGVMFVGVSDEISKMGTSDIPHELHLVHALHWPWQDWQLFLERSPIYHVEKARTPLLILHGESDTRVYPGQSLELYRFLKVIGKTPVRLVWYPGEGHGNRRGASRLDYTLRMLRWMRHYLEGPGGEPPPQELDYPGRPEPETVETAG